MIPVHLGVASRTPVIPIHLGVASRTVRDPCTAAWWKGIAWLGWCGLVRPSLLLAQVWSAQARLVPRPIDLAHRSKSTTDLCIVQSAPPSARKSRSIRRDRP